MKLNRLNKYNNGQHEIALLNAEKHVKNQRKEQQKVEANKRLQAERTKKIQAIREAFEGVPDPNNPG